MSVRQTTYNEELRTPNSVLFVIVLLLALGLLLALTGCGGNNTANLTAGNTQVKIGDAPADSVIAFELTVTQVSLTDNTGKSVTVFTGTREIELAHLAGTVESMALANVPAGTYSKASINYSGAEVTYIPTAGTTPVEKNFNTTGTATVTPASPVTIGNGSNILSIDVNVAQSLTFDAGGNPTAVNPAFTISSVALPPTEAEEKNEESGEVEDAVGTVSAAPANNAFTLTLQMTGQSATFNVSSSTQFSDGLTSFADIKQGMLLRVDATTASSGSAFNAKKVELVEASGSEIEGLVTVTNSPLTQFTIVAADGAGSGMAPASIGTNINVTVNASTKFRANTNNVDMSGLSFTFTGPVKGQSVEVEAATPVSAGATTADKVVLVKQGLNGTASAVSITGSTGTFTLTLAADSAFAKLSGVTTVTVHQQPGTELKGLTSVTNSASVKVRGLLFFDGVNYQLVAGRIGLP